MVVPTKVFLKPQNDQVITVDRLKDSVTGAFLNAATVTATLKDHRGNSVAGAIAIVLSLVGGSTTGKYRGQVEETFDPPIGTGYTLEIDAVEGGVVGHWEIPAEVIARIS